MNWNLSISYPWWFIVFCLLAGLAYAAVMYYKSSDRSSFEEFPWVTKVLPVLRFVLISLLAFLLLGPVLRYLGYQTEKPIVAVLVDESLSVGSNNGDSSLAKNLISQWQEQVNDDVSLQTIGFSNVSGFKTMGQLSSAGSESNMSAALRFVQEQYLNQNLAGVVMLTDGIYNAGSNPTFAAKSSKVPIYTIGLGDTTVYPDLAVGNVAHNSIAYLGDEFPMRLELKASELEGRQADVNVRVNGKSIFSKRISIAQSSFYKEIDLKSKATKVGQNKVDVVLTTFDDEINKANNNYTFYVDVVDGKKKIALWAAAPHPDLGVLRSAISSNQNYEAELSIGEFAFDTKYDLVVLHDWFANRAQLTLYEKLRANGVPSLIIVGQNFNPGLFNTGSQQLKYDARGRSFNAALPLFNESFEYFELDESLRSELKKWPPLRAPFGNYKGYRPSDVLCYQQIGAVPTQQPLILLQNEKNKRLGIINGTGLWQWRLASYESNGQYEGVYTLLTNMVQYLAIKEDKKRLKVYPSARQYGLGEKVTLLGELYNQSLDAVKEQEINVELKDAKGKSYKHTMTPSGSQYRLVLTNLAEGSYTYVAKATIGGVSLVDKGGFSVEGQQKELANLTADHTLLKTIAASSGGEFRLPQDADNLLAEWNEETKFTSILTEENKLTEFIKFKWIFWLLFGLLSVEWFVRKWAGGY